MASPADRLPNELWEQILVQCELTGRDLFRLQCVNRSFNQTINGSTPLLRTMEILHKPVEEKKHRIPNPVLWTSHLELRPFFYRVEVLAPKSPRNGGQKWKINIHVSLNLGSEARIANSVTRFGIKSNKRCFSDVLDGSWRRMKISRFPVAIEVPIRVYYLDAYYEEKTADSTGEMTLGDLAALLENVHSRSEEQHLELASTFRDTKAAEDTTIADSDSGKCHMS